MQLGWPHTPPPPSAPLPTPKTESFHRDQVWLKLFEIVMINSSTDCAISKKNWQNKCLCLPFGVVECQRSGWSRISCWSLLSPLPLPPLSLSTAPGVLANESESEKLCSGRLYVGYMLDVIRVHGWHGWIRRWVGQMGGWVGQVGQEGRSGRFGL